MGIFSYPKKIFIRYGGFIAIWMVKRRLKKRQKELPTWIVLAKLYCAVGDHNNALESLKLAQRVFPDSELLKKNLTILRQGGTLVT